MTAVESRESPSLGDASANARRSSGAAALGTCDVCGMAELLEIRCKVICRNCRTILLSCADL